MRCKKCRTNEAFAVGWCWDCTQKFQCQSCGSRTGNVTAGVCAKCRWLKSPLGECPICDVTVYEGKEEFVESDGYFFHGLCYTWFKEFQDALRHPLI